jgi:hypothetical protein
MPAENIKELLGTLSAAKLRKMDEALDRQISERQTEKEWITEVLAKKSGGSASSRIEEAARRGSAFARSPKNGTAETIREIIREQPGRVWMPRDIIEAAHGRGVASTPQAIRVALRRMGEKGFVVRGPDGEGWALAKSNGSAQESFDEAQTSKTSPLKALPAGRREDEG